MTLAAFVADWLEHSLMRPPADAYESVDGNTGLTLYRDERFQVQLWSFPPNAKVSDHAHPNIDSWLVRVSGKFGLRINGRDAGPSNVERAAWRGMRTWKIHIGPQDVHGVRVGDRGASFLSISERLDGRAPGSVHLNWEGTPLNDAHAAELREGAA